MTDTHHTAQHTETIDAPIAAVYQRWLDVESFPTFIPAVRSVTTSSEFYSHWTLSIAGITRTVDAEITQQLPEERIAWRTISGDVSFEGSTAFQAETEERTAVTLTVSWDPATPAERTAAALGADDRAIKVALRDFKRHVESHDMPPGHSYVTLR